MPSTDLDQTSHVQPRPYPPTAPYSDTRLHAESAAAALLPAAVEAGVPEAAPSTISAESLVPPALAGSAA
jgi:hypothetical protein